MNTVSHQPGGWLARISQAFMTFLALAVLAGIGWWGHHSGWRLPTFSTLSGQVEPETEAWCTEHGVPEEQCVACHAELDPPLEDYGWCAEHGIHQCTICHPELAQTQTTPTVDAATQQRVERGLEARPRIENNNRCPLYRQRIQIASEEAMTKVGVDVALVEEKPIVETINAPAEIVYDPTRVARLAARAAGTVWLAKKQVGDSIAKGEIVAIVDAAEVGEAKSKLLQNQAQVRLAMQSLNRLKRLRGDVVSEAEVLQAEATLETSRAQLLGSRQTLVNLGLPIDLQSIEAVSQTELTTMLQFLGLPKEIVQGLDPRTTTNNLLPVKAPFAGIVVERNIVTGEMTDTIKPLYVIADTSRMWLNIDVRQEDVPFVSAGRTVRFRAGVGSVEASGTIDWISSVADEATRTISARAVLNNADGTLRAGTFGQADIVLREEPNAPMIPSEALQWDGSCHIVFVRDKHFFDQDTAKLFHTRTVRPGVTDDGKTEIIAGLFPGEVVASKGSGILRAQLLKNNLGAG